MAKKKINQLDPGTPNLARLFAHADPVTGKALKGTLAQLVALFTANTPVKSYADIESLLDNTDLVIGYLAFVVEAGGDYGDPEITSGWGFYLYNGPDADELSNYTLLASQEGIGGGGGTVTSVTGTTNRITSSGGATPVIDIDAAYDALFPTREVNRAFSSTINFDKNEIFYAAHIATGNITYEVGSGNLINQSSGVRQIITLDGTQSLNFGTGFDFLYPGTLNGYIPPAGTYEIYFLYVNGSVSVNFPGISSESSGAVTLAVPGSFAAVADGENAIDLSWTNVTANEGYLIEYSLTGTGGWATLETTAIDAVDSSMTGLSAGDTRYFRIKTLGDGVLTLDSGYSDVISAQTENTGDVTAPTFTFTPLSGVTTWPINRPITLTANEPIRNADGSEITNANVATRITLKETNAAGANIAFTATIDGTKQIITITPDTHYGELQLVYVAINNVEDVNGNAVTVAISNTFTTTDFTFFNVDLHNRTQFGDILDSIWAAADTNFWLELTIQNPVASGTKPLVTKYDTASNQRSFHWYYNGADVYFGWVGLVNGSFNRVIKWTGVFAPGVWVLKYDQSIDTNDGLDRAILEKDSVVQGSKTLFVTNGVLSSSNIPNSTAYLTVGGYVNNAGGSVGTNFYADEAKDFIVRSGAGSVVEINVPNLVDGTDTSGNGRNGTWVNL